MLDDEDPTQDDEDAGWAGQNPDDLPESEETLSPDELGEPEDEGVVQPS